ncbi:hypothetical protein [Bdellovibrio sp. GT3]|uniref:hypothetical protein n=1 Tax=Bdellovibrio sp. GT3 TaxID=3136282 RepID=UPI0030F04383
MFLKFMVAGLSLSFGSMAWAQSGVQNFVENYAKLPKSYDAVQFRSEGSKLGKGCTLSMSGGYLLDGMKYLQLANDLGETVFVAVDSKQTYSGNTLKLKQRDEEPNEFGAPYQVINSLKIKVDDSGFPLKAEGRIDRQFPYRDTKISCEGFQIR